MGCFGYICKGCGTSIRGNCFDGGEKCILIHVRHGIEIGRVEGHYDEYGRVIEEHDAPEDVKFRGNSDINPNSHKEICSSEFEQKDSYNKFENLRFYKGEPISFFDFIEVYIHEVLKDYDYDLEKTPFWDALSGDLNGYFVAKNKYEAAVDEEDKELYKKLLVILAEKLCRELIYTDFFEDEFNKLPRVERAVYSGVVAYHSVCYHNAVNYPPLSL